MTKKPIKLFELWRETMDSLTREGLLLCSVDTTGKPNAMTIGWMTGGIVWGKPILTVLVRPSRHTFSRMEQVGEFTVNVMPPEFANALEVCGTVSGRDKDKFADAGLTTVPAKEVRVPIIVQGIIHYECRVVQKNDIIPANLAAEIKKSAYPHNDFHRVYYGEVLAAYATDDASKLLHRALI